MTLDVFREPRARISRFPTASKGLSFRTSRRFSSDGAGELRHQGTKTGHFTQVGIRATFLRRDFRRWMSSLFFQRGSIPGNLPPILERLKIDPGNYIRFINRTQKSHFHGFIGSVKTMRSLAQDFGRSFLRGQAAAAALFSPG